MEKYLNEAGKKRGAKKRFRGLKTCFSLILILTLLAAADKILREEAPVAEESSHLAEEETTQPENKAEDIMEAPWYLILINRDNAVPENYELELTFLDNGESVNKLIYPDLQKMFDDMRAEGLYPNVCSGYRPIETQKRLYEEEIKKYEKQGYTTLAAEELAMTWVAIPGTSEHQIGIAVDVDAQGEGSTDQQIYDWLDANSYKYGFILRYPSDKTDITGISYEPWHFRYVGTEAAEEIFNSGLCLEEYLRSK